MKAVKVKLTRPELKRQRDTLARYERFLPTLKLKHQLLQQSLLEAERDLHRAEMTLITCQQNVAALGMLNELPNGLDVTALSTPEEVTMGKKNIAGVKIPIFEKARFPVPSYSTLFTPPHVDELLTRWLAQTTAKLARDAQQARRQALRQEFIRVNQRLNLFEKVVIPQTKEAIHRIRIYLGDEQTAAVGRAKLTRSKQLKKRERARAAASAMEAVQ